MSALTRSDVSGLMRAVASAVKPYVEEKINEALRDHVPGMVLEQAREIAALQARIAALETKGVGGLRYRGVWQPGMEAVVGDCCTRDGSMWCCERATTLKPGDGNSGWRLCVKRGADGDTLFSVARKAGFKGDERAFVQQLMRRFDGQVSSRGEP